MTRICLRIARMHCADCCFHLLTPRIYCADCTERTRSRRTAGSHATRSGLGSSVSRNSEARLTRLEAILNEERQKRLEAEKEIAELKQQVGR
jgi:hypothetical protein